MLKKQLSSNLWGCETSNIQVQHNFLYNNYCNISNNTKNNDSNQHHQESKSLVWKYYMMVAMDMFQ